MFSRGSKARLTERDLRRFPGDSLFDRIARAVIAAGCLPRKELYEAWEVGRRARRRFRGGRVVDLGGGHGLLGQIMLLLDDSSPCAVVVDPALPPSRATMHAELCKVWPRLAGRVTFLASPLQDLPLESSDVVIASHACGALTDRVIERAASARARLAVLPCCHDLETCDAGGLTGWLDGALAVDVLRATGLAQRGYRVWTQQIPREITPQNRLLLAEPDFAHLQERRGLAKFV